MIRQTHRPLLWVILAALLVYVTNPLQSTWGLIF